jgi:hypothetical protein
VTEEKCTITVTPSTKPGYSRSEPQVQTMTCQLRHADGTIKATSVRDFDSVLAEGSQGPAIFRSAGAAEDITAAASVSEEPISTLFAPAPAPVFSPDPSLASGPVDAAAQSPGPEELAPEPADSPAEANGTVAAGAPGPGVAAGPRGAARNRTREPRGGKNECADGSDCSDYDEDGGLDKGGSVQQNTSSNRTREAGDNSCAFSGFLLFLFNLVLCVCITLALLICRVLLLPAATRRRQSFD